MAKEKKLAITLPEYERTYRVIRSVDRGLRQDSAPSCLFYNIVGAALMGKVLGVRARPVMGQAFLRVGEQGKTLAFADCVDGKMVGDNFHCWVQTEEHILDFTAPVYCGYIAAAKLDWDIPAKMFQRRRADSKYSVADLKLPGDFFFVEDSALTAQRIEKAGRSLALGDLFNVCATWLTKPPKAIPTTFAMRDDLGKVTNMTLDKTTLSTAW